MEQVGFVRKVKEDEMELEVRRASGWGSGCKECSSSCEVEAHVVVVPNNIGAKVGDFVEVEAKVGNLLKYTFILYMIPFMFLIAGIVIGNFAFKNFSTDNREILSFVSGLLFTGLSLLILKVIDNREKNKKNETISATKIL